MLYQSDNPSEPQYRLQFLRKLIRNHPFAFVGGLWLVMVLASGAAVLGILNPGGLEQKESKPALETQMYEPIPTPTTVEETTTTEGLPITLLGAIAIGCAAGSLVLTQALKYSAQGHPTRKAPTGTRPVATVRKTRRRPSQKGRLVPKTPQSGSSKVTVQSRDNRMQTTDEQLTQVTVLPPEENHPLDGGNESLADQMDLRKRHSLASLMRRK